MHNFTATKDFISTISLRGWYAVVFFTVAVTLTGIIAANVPLFDDDLVFANAWGCSKHTICPEEHFDPWGYAWEHRELTNGRLGDMFTPLFIMLPRWTYGIIYSFCYAVTMLLMMNIAQCKICRAPLKSMWIVGFSVLLFPWIDVFYTRAVFFNYFPAIIFTLISLKFFISARKLTGFRLILGIVTGIFTGCWHELMPVALFPAALVYCIATRKVTRNQWIISISIALGFLFVITAPSFFNRPNQLPVLQFSENRRLLAYLYTILLGGIATASIALIILRRRPHPASRNEKALVLSLVVPSIPCCLIMLNSLYETRICFPAIVFSIVAFFLSLPRYELKGLRQKLTTAVSVLMTVLIAAHLISVATDSVKVRRASEDIMSQATSNPEATIYYDLADIVANDTFHLYKTQGRSYINKLHSWDEFSDYTGYKYSFNVLPPVLKNFNISEAETVDAKNGVYYFKGNLIVDAPCDSTNYVYGVIEAKYDDGSVKDFRFMGTFFTDSSGNPLIHILPYQPRMPHKKPETAEIVEFNLCRRIMR